MGKLAVITRFTPVENEDTISVCGLDAEQRHRVQDTVQRMVRLNQLRKLTK